MYDAGANGYGDTGEVEMRLIDAVETGKAGLAGSAGLAGGAG